MSALLDKDGLDRRPHDLNDEWIDAAAEQIRIHAGYKNPGAAGMIAKTIRAHQPDSAPDDRILTLISAYRDLEAARRRQERVLERVRQWVEKCSWRHVTNDEWDELLALLGEKP